MTHLDPYDVRVAFDDIYGEDYEPSMDAADVAREIFYRASRERLAPPPVTVEVVGRDPTTQSFAVGARAVGAGVEVWNLPLFDKLRRRFAAATPAPKYVRFDTQESHGDFRNARQRPYVEILEARLAALEDAHHRHVADNHSRRLDELEDAFERHISDGHGGGRDFEIIGGAVERAALAASCCGVPISRGRKVWAWQDGDEILATIRVLGKDGRIRLMTTGAPAARFVDEVLGYASRIDADAETVLMVVPPLVQVLGAKMLVAELYSAIPMFLDCREARDSFVGMMVPRSDSSIAAAMALLQRCQRGDQRACAEAEELCRVAGNFVLNARDRLVRMQREKRRLS